MEGQCVFKFKYKDECVASHKLSQSQGPARIQSILKASKIYQDNLHIQLEEQLASNPNLKISYHKNCVSRYTSSSNTKKYEASKDTENEPPKKLRRSQTSFNFFTHCLYCGMACDLHRDPKHPGRWRPAYVCRSTVSEYEQKPYKEHLLEKCRHRDDEWAYAVMIRIEGAVSDLHAVEARYHQDCMVRFFSNKNPVDSKSDSISSTSEGPSDQAYLNVVKLMSEDKSRIWNSIELSGEYEGNGGTYLSRQQLVQNLVRDFNGDLLILSSPGYANLLTFKSQAANNLKMIKNDDDNDLDYNNKKIAKQIVNECKDITLDKSKYRLNLDLQTVDDCVSCTFSRLLGMLSPKLDNTLPAIFIGNIVTGILKNQPTDLQVALGVLFRESKSILGYTYDFGITCSYDEVLRFKKSAAVAAQNDQKLHGISNAENGLVQEVVDNFDAHISSPNGNLSTHSLAMIMLQPSCDKDIIEEDSIPRLKLDEMKELLTPEDDDHITVNSMFQKNPPMSQVPQSRLPNDFVTRQQVSNDRATELDFQFVKAIHDCDRCPEFNGYNTKIARDQGHMLHPKTKVVYLPLIDKPPAKPSTIMSAMLKAKQLTEATGQEYVVFTGDQQLYKIAVHIYWENLALFGSFFIRLGGMHLLMSYIGSIGVLMADSGIVEILESTFGGVLKMLNGKKFPENVRALRMLVEGLLHPIFENEKIECMDDLQQVLHQLSQKSRTAKLWINGLIQPVFQIMKYVRAEREGDWPLHLYCVQGMIPLFFAAGHFNYARYALYYSRAAEDIPSELQQQLLKGQHTMHHNAGLFNGIWSDMAIETTYMRYGHGQGGIIGITLRPQTLKIWAYSLHSCHKVVRSLDALRDRDEPTSQTTHKEEMEARITADSNDRQSIRAKLATCIDPLYNDQHPDCIINIVTGKVMNHPSLNVDNAVEVGKSQMEEFETSWPAGFHDIIHKRVNTMAMAKKHVQIGNTRVYDTEIIYARIMGLQESARTYDTKKLMAHELSPQPTSMFDKHGNMRQAKAKSSLKNTIKMEVSGRNIKYDVVFLDGCAVMWVVPWPANGTVQDYLNSFRHHIVTYLKDSEVYLVFDRYNDGSIKESTRISRDQGSSRVYTISTSTRLPSQTVMLTVSKNKKQLICLIIEDLIKYKYSFTSKLVITGNNPVPTEIKSGVINKRRDLEITHDEADTILINQCSSVHVAEMLVVADDTDVFVLLCHFVHQGNITGSVKMVSPAKNRAVIDINQTVQCNIDILPDLLAAHGLTGCDTVAMCFGVGKAAALKVLRSRKYQLNNVGNVSSSLSGVIQQATTFMLACYNQSSCQSMTDARHKVWAHKVSQKLASAPKLQSLPPTDEAFRENVARAHLQVAIWRHANDPNPPPLDPSRYGWMKDPASSSLVPITVPVSTPLAPDEILKLIRCSCESTEPCKSRRCSCSAANIACTTFCACQGDNHCYNEKTQEYLEHEDEDDE